MEELIQVLKVQARKEGAAMMVTIPKKVVRKLKIKRGEEVKMLFDSDTGRMIYELKK